MNLVIGVIIALVALLGLGIGLVRLMHHLDTRRVIKNATKRALAAEARERQAAERPKHPWEKEHRNFHSGRRSGHR